MSAPRSIREARAALATGEITSVELVQRSVDVAMETSSLGSFLDTYFDHALEEAAIADAALAAGEAVGPLHGVPLGIKDIFSTSESPATAQSLVLDPAWSDGDAVAVARLRAAGGIVLGKTSTAEFAIGLPDRSKPFPMPRNPWSPDRWAGGSSSGSGSAVATGAILGALGSDTAGSIRVPAAFCGITGLKPSFGRVPKSGCVPLAFTLDHVGPMARTAYDCAVMLQVIAGADPSDPSSLDEPVPDYSSGLTGDLTGVRVGIDRLARIGGAQEDAALPTVWSNALDSIRALGALMVEVELPLYNELTAANLVIVWSEALAFHTPDLRSRWTDYFTSTRTTIGRAVMFTGADYVQAQRVRRVGQRAVTALFQEVDLVITPTSRAGAPGLAGLDGILEKVGESLYTPYWDVVGNPVLSVPMGFTGAGLPLGMQIAGRPYDEQLVLRAGDAYQYRTQWHEAVPTLGALDSTSTVT